MVYKRRYLPSLGALATFEVAAKHLSFTLAGNELNVTQAAISQQIRGLEKALGVALFLRGHNSLTLTAAGQQVLAAVSSGLDRICAVVDTLNRPADIPVITCSGTNAAVHCWFKPQVDRFCAAHPEVHFVLLASDEDDTLRNFDQVDISLICGNERCDVGENLYFLFQEIVEPVCSPAYLRRRGPFSTSPACRTSSSSCSWPRPRSSGGFRGSRIPLRHELAATSCSFTVRTATRSSLYGLARTPNCSRSDPWRLTHCLHLNERGIKWQRDRSRSILESA